MKRISLFFAALAFCFAAQAAVINISSATPDALRLALAGAADGDVIEMAEGTYVESQEINIDAKGMVNINLAADIMKANPDVKYVVNGYADKATGSAKTNQTLSEKRAKAVYNALIKAGVNENQIEWRGLGGQPNMWNNSRVLTRVVVIEKAN